MGYIKEESTQICILGGGPAGYVAAIRATQLGAKVVLIECREIGGTCLNRGCIPTKSLLKTSELLSSISKSKEYGLALSVPEIDVNSIISRKNRVVKSLRMGLEHLMTSNGIEVINGCGLMEGAGKVVVKTKDGEVLVHYEKIIITTGSEPMIPAIPGIEKKGVLTSNEVLDLDYIPQNIVIIGAGVIGMEFATYFNSLGSKVTIIEMEAGILGEEDEEIANELLKLLKRQGIKFYLSSKVKEILDGQNGLEIVFEENGRISSLCSETILVAVGRKLNSTSSDITAMGIEITRGAIVVNEHMETNLQNVYAAGDAIGGKLLAHLAFAEGRVAAENALGTKSKLNYDAVPMCIYTNPEVALVGLNEKQLEKKGIEVKVGRFDFRNNGRALSHGEREGFVKVFVDKTTGVVLGGGIIGNIASELISELSLAVSLNLKAEALADLIHPHPTLSEAIMEACADAVGRAIHK